MANALLGSPATSYIQGREMGLQSRRAEAQEQRAGAQEQRAVSQEQRAEAKEKRQVEIDQESLRVLKQKGLEGAKKQVKHDASIIRAVMALPPSQQQAGFAAVAPRLQQKTLDMFTTPDGELMYSPQRAQMVDNIAKEIDKNMSSMYGKTIQAVSKETGKPVFLQVDKAGGVKELEGYIPPAKKGISVETPGGVKVQIGGSGEQTTGLDKVGARKEKEKIIKGLSTLDSIAHLEKTYRPEFFRIEGGAKQKYAHWTDYLGLDLDEGIKKFNEDRTEYFNSVKQWFNAYRKDITGAAAAMSEIKMLEGSVMNTKQAPHEHEASMRQLKAKVKRAIRLSQKILREGVPLGSKEYTRRHNAAWKAGEDDDPDERGKELEAQGLSFEERIEQLEKEGY